MRPSTLSLLLPLLSAPLLLAACDDAGFADGGPVRFRACPPDCSGGDQNTAVLGAYGVSNMPMGYHESTANRGATLVLHGAKLIHNGAPMQAEYFQVSPTGELRMIAATSGAPVYTGAGLIGASFDIEVVPEDPHEPHLFGKIKIKDYIAEPGIKDPTVTVYRYKLTTDIEPEVPGHPLIDGLTDWSLCTYDVETESYDAVLHPYVELNPETDRVEEKPGQFVFGCLSGAVSKTQSRLNVYYIDSDNGRTMDRSQIDEYLNAWRAMIDGVVTTEPGKLVAFEDLARGLVEWTSLQEATWPLEAVYDHGGAACRGTAHRRYLDPSNDIDGWDELPLCTEPYSQWGSVAIRVPPSQLPPL